MKIQSLINKIRLSNVSVLPLILGFILSVFMVVMGADAAYASASPAIKGAKMSPEHKDFLSKVRYIISKDEARFFKNLPDNRRDEFIEQFWAVRDPNPGSGENEFKEEYFRRIDEANRLFTVGLEGWQTDRGKTYILLGPPRHISEYPLGNMYDRTPYVVWHYPEVVIIFVDIYGDGDLRVDYGNRYAQMEFHAMVQEAFVEAKRQLNYMSGLFNYDFDYARIKKVPSLVFTFDLKKMSFKPEGDKMVSQLIVSVDARDKDYNDAWNYKKTHAIEFLKSDDIPKKITVQVPIDKKLNKGKYFFFTSVQKMDDKNKAFNNKLLKVK
jgi:GWxTD domain-containing protein